MSVVEYGNDYEYAGSRLRHSVVRFDGTPVYIRNVDSDCYVEFSTLGSVHSFMEKLKDFDLRPVPLGNININGSCTYSLRTPSKFYKQGLTRETFKTVSILVGLLSQDVANTIMGLYPKIYECFDLLICGEASEIAFSRDFSLKTCVKDEVSLVFRGDVVGEATWNKLGNNINYKLKNNRSYLNETLEELLHV